ncbi:MAG: HlyD family secretion protein [Bdellovibrionota bacterium]
MTSTFFRTKRALDEDGEVFSWLKLALSLGLASLWAIWLLFSKVTVYETSSDARIEVYNQSQSVEAPVSGQVLTDRIEVGRRYQAGEVLLELDARTNELALDEMKAQFRQADAAAAFSEDEVKKLAPLQAQGQLPDMDLLRAKLDAKKNRASADAFAASIQRLSYDIGKRQIKASVTGVIGEKIPTLHVGSVVREGDRLGSLIPSGDLRVVGYFRPSAALGRVHSGQVARLRLQGFPWAQYGSIIGRTTSVATEVRDGKIRVEAEINADSPSRVKLQHGLPGDLEVEVEKVSPATLLLRATGALLVRTPNPKEENPGAH